MLEVFQKKVESIAENYADLVNRNIQNAQETEVLTAETLNEVNEGIRMINHVAAALERINRIQRGNVEPE